MSDVVTNGSVATRLYNFLVRSRAVRLKLRRDIWERLCHECQMSTKLPVGTFREFFGVRVEPRE
jgi:hypothetical protein